MKSAKEKYEKNPKICLFCGKPIPYSHGCYKKFCNNSCSAKYNNVQRQRSEASKNKTSESLLRYYSNHSKKIYFYKCCICGKELIVNPKYGMCNDCFRKNPPDEYCLRMVENGKRAAASQKENRRSKNEKLFCEMCESYFEQVKHNESIFNGWDADVIIEDIKIAVLWNGKWHYESIGGHSVEQVQNRDKIKQHEIEKCGYRIYVIKDMGKFDPTFVKNEFERFIRCISSYGRTLLS